MTVELTSIYEKKVMKYSTFFGIILLNFGLFLFVACGDDEQKITADHCTTEATLIGLDARECACCGGWFIEIEGDTLRALTLPEEFVNSLALYTLPLDIYVEWAPDATPCLGDEIEVECLEVR